MRTLDWVWCRLCVSLILIALVVILVGLFIGASIQRHHKSPNTNELPQSELPHVDVQPTIPPLENTIADMKIGETGWALPGTLCTDGSIVTLYEKDQILEGSVGLHRLLVEKRVEGYAVTNYDANYRWRKRSCNGAHYAKVVSFIQVTISLL